MIALLLVLIVIGVVVGLIPMDASIKRVVVVLIIVAACFWLLAALGVVAMPRAFDLRSR